MSKNRIRFARSLSLQALEPRRLLAAYINEILVRGSGVIAATDQFIELRGEPGSRLADNTYLAIVNDGGENPGELQHLFDLSEQAFGDDGFLVLLQQDSPHVPHRGANVLQSVEPGFGGLPGDIYADLHPLSSQIDYILGSNAYLLLESPSPPALGSDLDVDNDGIADAGGVKSNWTVLDSVSLCQSTTICDQAYSDIVLAKRSTAPADITTPVGATVVLTDAYGYAARLGVSTGHDATDWIGDSATKLTAENGSVEFQVGQTSSQFQLPELAISRTFQGRLLDHVGATNFVGGASGSVIFEDQSPSQGVNVFADANGNRIHDAITHVVDPSEVDTGQSLRAHFPDVTITANGPDSLGVIIAGVEDDTSLFAQASGATFDRDDALRFDFHRHVDSVSMTAIGLGDSISNPISSSATLAIFDANGSVLGTVTSDPLIDGAEQVLTLASTGNIAYAIAFHSGQTGRLTQMSYIQMEAHDITGEDGKFQLPHLPKGNYTLMVSPNGAFGGEPTPLPIEDHETVVVDFTLVRNGRPIADDLEVTVNENTPVGATFAAINATDPEGHDILYSLLTPNSGFVVESDLGAINVDDPNAVDFELGSSHSFGVSLVDQWGAVSFITVTVTVINVDERPVVQGNLDLPAAISGQPFEYQLPTDFAIDPDGTSIVYSLLDQPPWLKLDSQQRRMHGVPTPDTLGIRTSMLLVSDTGMNGLSVSEAFDIDIELGSTPLHAIANPMDVDGNGTPSAGDALRVLNYILIYGSEITPQSLSGFFGFVDTTGDNRVTARDSLVVINTVAINNANGEAEFLIDKDEQRFDLALAQWFAAPQLF